MFTVFINKNDKLNMEITYSDNKLKKLCDESNKAQRKLGSKCARKLRSRLADLKAAESVASLVAGKPHPLKGDRNGQYAVSLDGGVRLVFEPANEPVPQKDDGGINWSEVTAVCIVFIGDYHD